MAMQVYRSGLVRRRSVKRGRWAYSLSDPDADGEA